MEYINRVINYLQQKIDDAIVLYGLNNKIRTTSVPLGSGEGMPITEIEYIALLRSPTLKTIIME